MSTEVYIIERVEKDRTVSYVSYAEDANAVYLDGDFPYEFMLEKDAISVADGKNRYLGVHSIENVKYVVKKRTYTDTIIKTAMPKKFIEDRPQVEIEEE